MNLLCFTPVRLLLSLCLALTLGSSLPISAQAAASQANAAFADSRVVTLHSAKETQYYLNNYKVSLELNAKELLAQKLPVRDQNFAQDVVILRPPQAQLKSSPLLILGGMGPLAGAETMIKAVSLFGEQRQIVLLQLTSIPDRTAAILADKAQAPHVSDLHQEVVAKLVAGIRYVASHVETTQGAIDLVVACNTAHFFIHEALQKLTIVDPILSSRVRLAAMPQAVASHIKRVAPKRPVLALYTTGTRSTGLYAQELQRVGVPFAEPDMPQQELLMRAIYSGIKAFNDNVAVQAGDAFFRSILQQDTPPPDLILSACTELPVLMTLLQTRASAPVRSYLQQVQLTDPMDATLSSLGQN